MNLLPVWAVIVGSVGAGDLFALYWLENLVVMAVVAIQIDTATGAPDDRPSPIKDTSVDQTSPRALRNFFFKHFGVFTAVHLVFTCVVVAFAGGFKAGPTFWIVMPLATILGYVWMLGVDWFGRGTRELTSPIQALLLPYPRLIILHGGLMVAFVVLVFSEARSEVLVVAVLCGLKVLVDALLFFTGPMRIELT